VPATGGPETTRPRSKGPIIIKNTPRSVAASKVRSLERQYPPGSKHPQHHNIYGTTPYDDPAPTPYKLATYGEESLYTLVLLRHGESEWNRMNRYTGWCDVNLTSKGEAEARSAGRLLYESGIEIDHAFTSLLRRASFSCNMALNCANHPWVPVTKTWRLNERHYGALQGYNKDTAYDELGLDQELVMQMRRAYDVRPPRMEDDHPYWHGKDRRYVLVRRRT
jgi:2,3-bisphosphoglycerate-dependent phosphoglycerate mutase